MHLDSDTNIKNDLRGEMVINFNDGNSLDEYCRSKIKDYNPGRFEALAIRVYYGKETAVILYAIDKERQEGDNFSKDKIPVKKFKLEVSFLLDMVSFIKDGNFTVTTGNYPLSDIEVINK